MLLYLTKMMDARMPMLTASALMLMAMPSYVD
jgi:hypothetical protein